MSGKRSYLWSALVWVLIPFTMAAGLPRMECRCAAAKGLVFCECCFKSNGNESSDSDQPARECCGHNQAGAESNDPTAVPKSSLAAHSSSDCPICPQVTDRRPSNCCNWTSAVLAAPAGVVMPAVPTDVVYSDIILSDRACSVLASLAQHDNTSTFWPQLDRLTVFQHLVI